LASSSAIRTLRTFRTSRFNGLAQRVTYFTPLRNKMPARLYFFSRRARTLLGASALLLAGAEVYVDWDTWIELNVAILYSLPVVVAAAARNRPLIWLLTLLLFTASFAVYA